MTNNEKRILQYENALKWFDKASTLEIVKTQFNVMIDTVSVKFADQYKRFEKINEDISEIYVNGTDEERRLIDEVIKKVDRERVK